MEELRIEALPEYRPFANTMSRYPSLSKSQVFRPLAGDLLIVSGSKKRIVPDGELSVRVTAIPSFPQAMRSQEAFPSTSATANEVAPLIGTSGSSTARQRKRLWRMFSITPAHGEEAPHSTRSMATSRFQSTGTIAAASSSDGGRADCLLKFANVNPS